MTSFPPLKNRGRNVRRKVLQEDKEEVKKEEEKENKKEEMEKGKEEEEMERDEEEVSGQDGSDIQVLNVHC